MAEITYFKIAGKDNTKDVLELALKRYKQGDIDRVVIASTYGDTASQAAELFKSTGAKLVIVGEVLDGQQNPSQELQNKLQAQGHQILWGLPLGAMSAFTREHTATMVADAYRRISEGFKVVCEIVLIATSLGYLRTGQKVISVAGTSRGADTAIVATAAAFTEFKNFEVNEILCKPYQRTKE